MRSSFFLSSILDNDFYKFTMQQAVVRLFPYAKAKYQFINRGKHKFPEGFGELLRESVNQMVQLRLSKEEKKFLQVTCPYLDPLYLDFLEGYRYNPEEVHIQQVGDNLIVKVEGLWYRSILWEIPLLSLISELYYKSKDLDRDDNDIVIDRTREKIEKFKQLGVTVAEFGTRRRHSYEVQRLVLHTLQRFGKDSFIGTSNVHMAMIYNEKPIGTHAHEWFMYHAAHYGFKMSNVMGLENWVKVYRGDLGIALSDTYTTNIFFKQFDKMFSKLFDGVRHDSGDPILFAEDVIAHYRKMGINPLSKNIVFSDGLDFDKVQKIALHCKGEIGMSFGIGTNLTNDVGLEPMNIVIKMTDANHHQDEWTSVVKLSDEKGKYTGNFETINLAKTILGIE